MNVDKGTVVQRQKTSTLSQNSSLVSMFIVTMTVITAISLSIVWGLASSIGVGAVESQGDYRPVGSSIEGYWSTAPQGYLLEDGTTYPCSGEYQNLCAVIGSTFGGDGTTTFSVPDSRGQVGVAKSTVDIEFNKLNKSNMVGEKTVTLQTENLPAHDHDFSGQTIYWGSTASISSPVYFRQIGGNQDRVAAVGGSTRCGSNQPCGSTWLYTCQGCSGWVDTDDNTGGGGAHNNLMPYIVQNRAIKY